MTPSPAALLSHAAALLGAGEWKYWLPPNYSTHGDAIDNLFIWIFWITTIIFFLVEGALLVFLIKYRYRPERRKGIFTHGNTRLEMAWTLAPAVILLIIALATKRVWDDYRFSKMRDDPNRAQVLVVGEQFKWNFVFPGPDQKLGKYLAFPQPTDAKYRTKSREDAIQMINSDISTSGNPLGQLVDAKDKTDPGLDDDYSKTAGRPLVMPFDRPLDVNLSSKDVLHDFFLPEFRVKLDAVPGMRGHIVFKSRKRSTIRMPIDQVPAAKGIWLDTLDMQKTPRVEMSAVKPRKYTIFDPADRTARTFRSRVWLSSFQSLEDGARSRLMRTGLTLEQAKEPQRLAAEVEKFRSDLKALGISELTVIDHPFEIVCEELCGGEHATMRGEVYFVSNDEYMNFLQLSAPNPPKPTTAPVQPVATAGDAR